MKPVNIREATALDLNAVLDVETRAFGDEQGPEIADLVAALLSDPTAEPVLSLLAEEDGRAVGHILFTRSDIRGCRNAVSAAILAPLAIVPEMQGQGIGGRLIAEGLQRLAASGVDLVFVLGYPEYYPRHGFRPAGDQGFEAPYPIPAVHAAAWMVQALHPGVIDSASGTVTCADALNRPEHWRE